MMDCMRIDPNLFQKLECDRFNLNLIEHRFIAHSFLLIIGLHFNAFDLATCYYLLQFKLRYIVLYYLYEHLSQQSNLSACFK